jgi:hypothetical protein
MSALGTFATALGGALASGLVRAGERLMRRATRPSANKRAHYYQQQTIEGEWSMDKSCAYCGRFDPMRPLFTEPDCPGAKK